MRAFHVLSLQKYGEFIMNNQPVVDVDVNDTLDFIKNSKSKLKIDGEDIPVSPLDFKINFKWNYSKSIEKAIDFYKTYKVSRDQLIDVLYQAHINLTNPGARTDLKDEQTWENWLKSVGISRTTAYRWLAKRDPVKLAAAEAKKEKQAKEHAVILEHNPYYDVDIMVREFIGQLRGCNQDERRYIKEEISNLFIDVIEDVENDEDNTEEFDDGLANVA